MDLFELSQENIEKKWSKAHKWLCKHIASGRYRLDPPARHIEGIKVIFAVAMWSGLKSGKTILSKSGKTIVFPKAVRIDDNGGLGRGFAQNLNRFEKAGVDLQGLTGKALAAFIAWHNKHSNMLNLTASKIKVGKVGFDTNDTIQTNQICFVTRVAFVNGLGEKVETINVPAILPEGANPKHSENYRANASGILGAIHLLSEKYWAAQVEPASLKNIGLPG